MNTNRDRANQYRERAAEMRAIAENLQTAKARESFFAIAEQYEEMARTAAAQEKVRGEGS